MNPSASLEELARQTGAMLLRRQWMAATAESCTGGWIAEALTAIAGSSAWFERGFVTYSNEAKMDLLGVRAETLEREGAVSEATAREMALGALGRSRAQVAVSVTGIAGPSGGSPAKPVGTVCIAWARHPGSVVARTFRFDGDRESVRRQSVEQALRGLLAMTDGA